VRTPRVLAGLGLSGLSVAVGCALGYDFTGYTAAPDGGPSLSDGGTDALDAGTDATVDVAAEADACVLGDHNCGRCGHDCFGGTCVGGQCTAYPIAMSQSRPYGLAIGDAGLFWTLDVDAGGIEQGSPTGGVVPFATGQASPQDLALSTTYVYWTTLTDVVRCPLGGGCSSPESIATGEVEPVHLAAPDFIYWTVLGSLVDGGVDASLIGTGLVMRADPASPQDASVLASAQLRPNGLAVDSKHLYWVDKGTDFMSGVLWQAGLDGSNATPMATGLTYPQRIALDDQNVYWTNFGTSGSGANGSVMTCPISGCGAGPTTLASGQSGAEGIAVDGSNVYWTASNAGTVSVCPKLGCGAGPVVLANNQQSPQALVQDNVSLYWTEWVLNGAVMRLAKP
jgi:hypothetical protein